MNLYAWHKIMDFILVMCLSTTCEFMPVSCQDTTGFLVINPETTAVAKVCPYNSIKGKFQISRKARRGKK